MYGSILGGAACEFLVRCYLYESLREEWTGGDNSLLIPLSPVVVKQWSAQCRAEQSALRPQLPGFRPRKDVTIDMNHGLLFSVGAEQRIS